MIAQAQAVGQSVLDPIRHARLMADMESVCLTANVPQQFILQSAKSVCGPKEMDWLANFHEYRKSKAGAVLVGGKDGPRRCMAMAGALIRNFIDARVVNLNALLEDKDKIDPTVLLVPNLHLQSYGKTLAAHELQDLYDLLLQRLIANRPTVVYVQDMEALREAYGQTIYDHLIENLKLL
jgi:hypothetical protein